MPPRTTKPPTIRKTTATEPPLAVVPEPDDNSDDPQNDTRAEVTEVNNEIVSVTFSGKRYVPSGHPPVAHLEPDTVNVTALGDGNLRVMVNADRPNGVMAVFKPEAD